MAWNPTGGNLKGPQGAPGQDGAKGDPGKSLHVASIDIMSNSDVAKSALTPNDQIAVGDLVSDGKGDVYTISSIVNDTTVHVSNAVEGVSFKGPQGETGASGKDGTGVTILGSFDSLEALKAAHATGTAGDSYLIGGHLYVWDATGTDWKDVGNIQGPKGDKGETGTAGTNGTNGLGWTYGHGAPSGSQPVGSLYLDVDSGAVYSYQADKA